MARSEGAGRLAPPIRPAAGTRHSAAPVPRAAVPRADGTRVEVRAGLPGNGNGVLEPLRREVRAARAIAGPDLR
ncbi:MULTISPECIES: hypothetical protein [unclassified Streptomyces]|uniref:hypothetical protein n=1 Tax=unclassified Streptomyces TaxID=2593676 RepID=UPI0006AFC002|nr:MULTISPECIES: hypothetical protein [unclassified Streptomyces]KOX23762.1 hypothetical protein ADL06_21745 [Streptomyces sp. NRRL F-6491]KOX40748.1 hypothetical protein ADL08_21230 [Streptomyces sp. NRRL F-6492]